MTNVMALRDGLDYLNDHLEYWDQGMWSNCFATMVMKAHDNEYNPIAPSQSSIDAEFLIDIDHDEDEMPSEVLWDKFFSYSLSLDQITENVEAYESQNESRTESTKL